MNEMVKYKLEQNIIIKGKIQLKTGLHIGSDKDKLSIGGVDSPIIKDPLTNKPIIPGSSLKGKMRTLMEYKTSKYSIGKDGKGYPHASPQAMDDCNDENCSICVVYGSIKNNKTNLTRLIVRDSIVNNDFSLETETKVENSIDRIKGSASSPRFIERIPASTLFDLDMVYMIFNKNKDNEHLREVFEALALVEDSYLGGSGSRGYGKVEFKIDEIIVKNVNTYKNNPVGEEILSKKGKKGISVIELLQEYDEIMQF